MCLYIVLRARRQDAGNEREASRKREENLEKITFKIFITLVFYKPFRDVALIQFPEVC